MKKKIIHVLPSIGIELLILSIILTYCFSTDPGLFQFYLPFDFLISVMVVSIMVFISYIVCVIFDFILYIITKKTYKITNILYYVTPLVPFILFVLYRFY